MNNFKVVCAWCKEHMNGNPKAEKISHGMCEKCAKKNLRRMIMPKSPCRTCSHKHSGECDGCSELEAYEYHMDQEYDRQKDDEAFEAEEHEREAANG